MPCIVFYSNFTGLNLKGFLIIYTHFTELDSTDEMPDEEEQQLSGQLTWTPQNFRHIDENDPARHSYHRYGLNACLQTGLLFTANSQTAVVSDQLNICNRIMMQHAAQGDPTSVEEILEDMEDFGLEPGPFAFHAQIFAHVKAGQPDAGLEVMRDMHSSGANKLVMKAAGNF